MRVIFASTTTKTIECLSDPTSRAAVSYARVDRTDAEGARHKPIGPSLANGNEVGRDKNGVGDALATAAPTMTPDVTA